MSTVKLQVPIEEDIRDQWGEFAHRHGFDSLQAYIRFLAKADVDGRRVNLEESVRLRPETSARYEQMIADLEKEKKSGKVRKFASVDEFMKGL